MTNKVDFDLLISAVNNTSETRTSSLVAIPRSVAMEIGRFVRAVTVSDNDLENVECDIPIDNARKIKSFIIDNFYALYDRATYYNKMLGDEPDDFKDRRIVQMIQEAALRTREHREDIEDDNLESQPDVGQ